MTYKIYKDKKLEYCIVCETKTTINIKCKNMLWCDAFLFKENLNWKIKEVSRLKYIITYIKNYFKY